MLSKKDLLLIRGVMEEVIEQKVPNIVRPIVREEIDSLMEHQILPQFNEFHQKFADIRQEFSQVHKELASIRNSMVTKDFLEERLENFRIDLELSYRRNT